MNTGNLGWLAHTSGVVVVVAVAVGEGAILDVVSRLATLEQEFSLLQSSTRGRLW